MARRRAMGSMCARTARMVIFEIEEGGKSEGIREKERKSEIEIDLASLMHTASALTFDLKEYA